MSMMAWVAPGFRHILYKLLNAQNNTDSDAVPIWTKDIPTAATDGFNILINPDFFFELDLGGRVFVLAHEIWHNMVDDVSMFHRCRESGSVTLPSGKKLKWIEQTMQLAADARINAALIESKIGTPPKEGWFDKDAQATDSVYTIYERYYIEEEQKGKGPGGQGNQPGKGGQVNQPGKGGQGNQPGNKQGNGFDTVMKPGAGTGKNAASAVQERNPQEWAVEIAIAKALEDSRSQGKMAAGLERLFKQLLHPEVDWRDHIETLVKRTVGDGSVNWREPHAWLGDNDYFVPADTGSGAGWVVIWGDTSGSIGDKTLAKNISELAGLMEQVTPSRLTLIWCDAGLHKGSVNEITDIDELRKAKPVGGGGTNYKPVLDWIAKNNRGEKPDLFIGFTDGYVDFPKKEHPFPTIWACNTDQKFPFGQVVRIKEKAA